MITKAEKTSLFRLGRDRYAFHGREAYLMKYPHHDSQAAGKAAQAYIAGVKSMERGLSVERELKVVLQ